jgi:hypothetical protein
MTRPDTLDVGTSTSAGTPDMSDEAAGSGALAVEAEADNADKDDEASTSSNSTHAGTHREKNGMTHEYPIGSRPHSHRVEWTLMPLTTHLQKDW